MMRDLLCSVRLVCFKKAKEAIGRDTTYHVVQSRMIDTLRVICVCGVVCVAGADSRLVTSTRGALAFCI